MLFVPLKAGELDVATAQPAIARDLSTKGIGIITSSSITAEKAIVVLPGVDDELFAQIELLHTERLGIGFSLLNTKIVKLVTPNEFPILAELTAAMKQLVCLPS